jgi:O-antigen ligase
MTLLLSFSNKRRVNYITIILLTLLVFSIGISLLDGDLSNRFSFESIFGIADQGSGRIDIWRNSFEALLLRPILGYGAGNVYYVNLIFGGRALGAHNMFLSISVELGFIGLFLFSIFLIQILKELYRRNANMELAALIGILVSCMFLDALSAKFLWGTLLILMLRNRRLIISA